MKKKLLALLALVAVCGLTAQKTKKKESNVTPFTLHSSVFDHMKKLPDQYTDYGHVEGDKNVSPPLHWKGVPAGTKSFALICRDPDAPGGDWVHWVMFNIPGDKTELTKGVPQVDRLPSAMIQGVNSWKKDNLGYRGPRPPKGTGRHRYIFRLYALDTEKLELGPGIEVSKLEVAMKEHILGVAQLIGTYSHDDVNVKKIALK